MQFPEFQNRLRQVSSSILAISMCTASIAADIDLFPGDSFEVAVESLNPGDTLTVHPGTYTDSGRISIGVKGTPANPVVVQGAPGQPKPLISRSPGDVAQNTINIEGAEYLTIRGLEITSNGGDGINMSGNPSYITLEDLEIHDISVGINFRSSMHHITVRRNHIYRTNDTGEGMYVGCNYATCAVTDSIIENNWIHDTLAATQGDGIEIKRGSHSNIIRDNVIHDTNWPCVLLYGTEGNPRNVVEGNVMWNCGEAGIQVAADTVIKNNIILDSPDAGLLSLSHQGVSPANLEIVHNTIVTDGTCLYVRSWDSKPGMVFANNALYCASGGYNMGGVGGVAFAGNVLVPSTGSIPSNGYTEGRSVGQDFVDKASRNVYPSSDSVVLGAGDAAYSMPVDFNGTSRNGSIDAGAYAWTGAQNPGWNVTPGFKNGSAAGPTLMLDAAPSIVAFQGVSTLTWTTSSATECNASDDWSGPRDVSGQEDTNPLEQDSTFTLTCSNGSGVSVSDSVTVTVDNAPANPPTLVFTSNASSVPMNGSATLTWQSTDADSCLASGAWSGQKPTSGSESSGSLSSDATFNLDCTGPGGSIARVVNVTVEPPAADDPPSNSGDTGGGSVDWQFILTFVLLLSTRLRRGRHLRS